MNGSAGKLVGKAEEALEEGIIRMVLGRIARVRLLIGPVDAISRVAVRRGGVAAAHEAFSAAHWALVSGGDDAARIILRQQARVLRQELRAAAAGAPDIAKEAERALREVEDIMRRIRVHSGGLASATIKANWWDRLRDLARSDSAIRSALLDFEDACASGDSTAIARSAQELITRVSGRVSMSKARAFSDRINGVVRRLLAIAPTGEGSKVLVALADHIDQLKPGDPAREALASLTRAVRDNGDRWMAIANVVAGMKKATNPEEARGLVWRIKGMIGEMLAVSTRAYKDIYESALANAEALVRRLNATGPGGWEITTRRAQVRAPASAQSARLAPFYDDAILVRRIVAGQPEGEAIVVLATQIKSGDWSSASVIEQIHNDLLRELGGRIEMDGRLYRLFAAPSEFAPIRVFAGTTLPPPSAVGAARLSIQPIVLPMSGDAIETMGRALLEANQLLP